MFWSPHPDLGQAFLIASQVDCCLCFEGMTLAGAPGIEPGMTESKSVVLPITLRPYYVGAAAWESNPGTSPLRVEKLVAVCILVRIIFLALFP